MGLLLPGGEKVSKLTRERCLSGGGTGGTGGTRRANSRLRGYGKWDGWYQQAGHWDIGTPWSPGPLRLLRRDGEQSTGALVCPPGCADLATVFCNAPSRMRRSHALEVTWGSAMQGEVRHPR